MQSKELLWTIIGEPVKRGKSLYLFCRCRCGKETWVRKSSINVDSFGCRSCRRRNSKGGADTKLYGVWAGMKQRCYYAKHRSYQNYGGRGVVVCEQWKKRFAKFEKWALESGYREGLTLDRINNSGNYEPSNCRWVEPKEQNRNQRSNIYFELHGKRMILKDWTRLLGINYDTVRDRIYSGWDIKEALFTEVNSRKA